MPAAPCWLLIEISNCPGMHGADGVAVGVGVGTIGVALAAGDAETVTATAVGVDEDGEPQPAITLATATAAAGTSNRRIAPQRTRCRGRVRASAVAREILVSIEDRGEEVAFLRHTVGDGGDGPAVGTEIGVVQLLPRDRDRDRCARRGPQ